MREVDQQQIDAEKAIAQGDEAVRAAEKRAAALEANTVPDKDPAAEPAEAKPAKARRQTTR